MKSNLLKKKLNLNLNLKEFKTKYCPKINELHDYKQCFFYHSYKDQRRNNINYYKNICRYYKKQRNANEVCPFKEKCKYCHNNFELHYHPLNYKKKFCADMENCLNKKYCSFAHSPKEITIDLIHQYDFDLKFFLFKFKTEFCPIPIKRKHDKKNCVYAHNYQDFKRPFSSYFKIEQCDNWKKKKYKEYDQQCFKGFNCYKMHGWKEIYFNPFINDQYKTDCKIYIEFKKILKRYNNLNKEFELFQYFTFSFLNLNSIKKKNILKLKKFKK